MPKPTQPTGKPRSYRFDAETVRLIERLCEAMPPTETGRPRTATDVIRIAVRELAKKHIRTGK